MEEDGEGFCHGGELKREVVRDGVEMGDGMIQVRLEGAISMGERFG
jgi:hypothetical protein